MHISYHKYSLILKTPFQISYGTYNHRISFIIQISNGNICGYGEAVCIDYYGWSVKRVETDIQFLTKRIDQYSFSSFAELRTLIQLENQVLSNVRSAFDCACWDLEARASNVQLCTLISPGIKKDEQLPISSFTISGENAHVINAQLRDTDWPLIKIKMGTNIDKHIIEVMSQHPGKIYRIDANAGWNKSKADQYLNSLATANIEFIEQPFSPDDTGTLNWMKSHFSIPVIADEACQDLRDIESCAEHYDGINIKLMKCGGITPALDMIDKARSHSLKIMIGCMTESSCGISVAAQLLDLVDYADLDGAYLLQNDPAVGVVLNNGRIEFSKKSGSGAHLKNIPT